MPSLLWTAAVACLLSFAPAASAEDFPEYRLKVAFLYNFAVFTEWPAEVGTTLQFCLQGTDPFGRDLDALQGKPVGARSLQVQRKTGNESLKGCHIVFIAATALERLPRVLDEVRGLPVLLVADSPGAAGHGVMLNLSVAQNNKITFEANLPAARAARLQLSSKLLRLATEVIQ
jgi:YfiR/HmsC-like